MRTLKILLLLLLPMLSIAQSNVVWLPGSTADNTVVARNNLFVNGTSNLGGLLDTTGSVVGLPIGAARVRPQDSLVYVFNGRTTGRKWSIIGTAGVSGVASVIVNGGSPQTGVVSLTIPTNTNALTNGANFITSAGAPVQSVNGSTGAVLINGSETKIAGDGQYINVTGLGTVAVPYQAAWLFHALNADSIAHKVVDPTAIADGFVLSYQASGNKLVYVAQTGGGSGLTNLNTLTASTQTFAVGTAGTNFGIVSSGSTHTFNIPDGSASNRGLLTSANFTAFNTKQPQLSGTGYLKFATTTPSYLTPTQVTADLDLFTTTLKGLVPAPSTVTGKVLSDNGTWVSAGGIGTVTSVGASVPSSLLTITGSPVTGAGTLAFGLATAAANTAFGNFTGSTATPGFGKVPVAALATGTANTVIGYDGSGNPTSIAAGTNITILGGTISASGSGGSSITTKYIAYVDSSGSDITGVVSDPAHPFRSMDTALYRLKALGVGGAVRLGVGQFNSPNDSAWSDNIMIIGAQRPSYDWVIKTGVGGINDSLVSAPTKLVGGSILHGQMHIVLHNGIRFYNLGVDNGSAWVTGGGIEGDCLSIGVFDNSATVPFNLPTGIEVRNCSFLGRTANSAFHCLLLQRASGAVVDNCTMVFGTHGFVMKTKDSYATNILTYMNATDGIILKSDTYASCGGNVVNGFLCRTFPTFPGGTGLVLEANSNVDMEANNIYNGNIWGMTQGIIVHSTTLATSVKNSILSNISIKRSGLFGLVADSCYNITMNTVTSDQSNNAGFEVHPSRNGPVYLNNCAVTNALGDGFHVQTSGALGTAYFSSSHATNNSSYGLRQSGTIAVYADLVSYASNTSGNTNVGAGGLFLSLGASGVTVPGSTNYVIYNNSGNFAATSDFQFNPTTHVLSVTGAAVSSAAPLTIENTSTVSGGNNVAMFFGNRSSTTNIDDNTNIGIRQKDATSGNFVAIKFYSSSFNNVGGFGAKIQDVSINRADLLAFMNNGGLKAAMTLKWTTGNALFGYNDTTDRNAAIQLPASTATNAHLFLAGGVDPTSPTDGMMWFNNTTGAWNVRVGGTTINLIAPGQLPFLSNLSLIKDNTDNTKQFKFNIAGFTTGQTRIMTLPDANFQPGGLALVNSWTAANAFSASVTGLSVSAHDSGANMSTTLYTDRAVAQAIAGVVGAPFSDASALVKDNVDATKTMRFELGGLATSTALVATPPGSNFTMARIDAAQTFVGINTIPAPFFTSMTSSGSTDSVLTGDPATGKLHWRTGNFSLKVANGLTAPTTDSIILGGTLNQNVTIDGSATNFNMTMGNGTGNYLTSFAVFANTGVNLTAATGSIALIGNLKLKYLASGNTNLNLTSVFGIGIELTTITANRTITLPSPTSNTQVYDLFNTNTAAFTWTFASTVKDLAGNTITEVLPGSHVRIYANGTSWYILDVTNAASTSGSFSQVGTATTTFTVTTGKTLLNSTYKVNVTPTSALSAALFYVSNKTATTFDVVYLAGLTGTVTFDWSIAP